MKKKRKKPVITPLPKPLYEGPEGSTLHFRLCHVCLYLNESTMTVPSCQKCGHTLNGPALELLSRLGGGFEDETDPFMDPPEEQTQVNHLGMTREDTDPGIAGLDVRW